jgi:hypothetical protein
MINNVALSEALLRLTRFLRRTGGHFAGKRYVYSRQTGPNIA